MSIFFDQRISPPLNAGGRTYLDIKWHPVYPLLAQTVDDDKKGGLVSIYDHQKEEAFDVDLNSRLGIQVCCTAWHPKEPHLAIGFESGEVVIWNQFENESFEGAKNHIASVVMLKWSHCGNLLVSADSLGCLVVWAANLQGHVQPKATHDFRDAVCQIVFRRSGVEGNNISSSNAGIESSLDKITSWRPKTGRREVTRNRRRQGEKSGAEERSFFVGLLNGAIFYLKENGSSEEVLTSGSSVKWLLYHQAREILIVMTEAAILGQFSVDANGGLSEMNKIKLSGRGDVNLSWVGVGVLGIISEDLSLRLWDVDSGDNHVLEPKGGNYSNDEYLVSIDYNGKAGFLCCNTNKGKLIVWRELKPKALESNTLRKGDEEERWEWYSTFPIAPNARSVKWCPSIPDVLAINAVREMFVLRQQDICATFDNKINIIQNLASQLDVFAIEDDLKTELNTEIQIKGFTNTKTHICVWDGAKVEVYELGIIFQPNSYNLAGKFADKSEIIYIFEKSLFLLEPQQIQVRSFQGILKQTLTFSSTEGYPINFTGFGEYITASTMNGYLKMWHVAQREAKVHVPAKDISKTIKGFGEIIQAKNNCEGTKVGFTIAKKTLLPDSRFFVWDVSSDSVVHLDCPKMFVTNIFWEPEDPVYLAIELKVIPKDLQGSDTDALDDMDMVHPDGRSKETTSNLYILHTSKNLTREILRRKYYRHLEKNEEVLPVEKLRENVSELMKQMRNDPEFEDVEPWILLENNDSSLLLPRSATARSTSGKSDGSLDLNERPSTTDSIDSGVLVSTSSSFVKGYRKPMRTSRKSTAVEKLKESESLEYFQKDKPANSPASSQRQSLSLLDTDDRRKPTTYGPNENSENKLNHNELTTEDKEVPSNQIRTLFICSQKGILTHEKIEKDDSIDTLLGIDVPYWYYLSKTSSSYKPVGKFTRKTNDSYGKSNVKIQRQQIIDFKGVEVTSSDKQEAKQIKKALLSYVYHNLCGDVDKALMAMGDIRSDDIWKNMARLCLKSKRVDVAATCFAKMQNAPAAKALRLSREQGDELDAQIAMVALQLNMMDEAEKLYRSCGRYDLLLDAYITCEKFPEAIELCEKHCRIQLRTTYYCYAKYLEEEGNVEDAIEMYENSGNHRYEVPRMLLNNGEYGIKRLHEYVEEKKDKELYKRWAYYLEAQGDMKSALEYYELAMDWIDVTRLLLYCQDLNRAMMVAETVKDRASCHRIAGVLYEMGQIDKAVDFYTRAEAYGPAMRVCKENQMDEKLWNLSNLGESIDQLEAARYYETKDPPDYEKAVLLYHKSGYGSKAMDLAFVTQEFTALQKVAKDLIGSENTKADPEMLKRCADFFVENGQYDHALEMYIVAKKYVEAMEVCVEHRIQITEEMAEKLTAPKGDGIDVTERNRLLEKMGECCMLQGNYHLSAKKFTQAGNKIAAMKALLKSGDTERIIFYANVSRHRDIYLMAANYLQTTQWQNSPKTIEQIISMYTKAKSPESIGTFYEAWAQANFEIDKDYEKSLENLNQATEVFKDLLQKDGSVRAYEVKLNKLYAKIGNVNAFLALREMMKISPMEAIEKLRILLQEKNIESSVSRGDIYSILIEYYTNQEDFEAAIETLMELRRDVLVPPSKFLKNETLQALNRALGTRTNRELSGLNSASSKPGTRRASTAFQGFDEQREGTSRSHPFTFTTESEENPNSSHVVVVDNEINYDEDDDVEEIEDLDEHENDVEEIEDLDENDVEYVEVDDEEEEEGVDLLNHQEFLENPDENLNPHSYYQKQQGSSTRNPYYF